MKNKPNFIMLGFFFREMKNKNEKNDDHLQEENKTVER